MWKSNDNRFEDPLAPMPWQNQQILLPVSPGVLPKFWSHHWSIKNQAPSVFVAAPLIPWTTKAIFLLKRMCFFPFEKRCRQVENWRMEKSFLENPWKTLMFDIHGPWGRLKKYCTEVFKDVRRRDMLIWSSYFHGPRPPTFSSPSIPGLSVLLISFILRIALSIGTSSVMRLYKKHSCDAESSLQKMQIDIASRELTYPLLSALLKMMFQTSPGGICDRSLEGISCHYTSTNLSFFHLLCCAVLYLPCSGQAGFQKPMVVPVSPFCGCTNCILAVSVKHVH